MIPLSLVLGLILGDPPLYYRDTPLKASVWYEPFVELHHILCWMPSAQEIDDYIAQHYPKMDSERRELPRLSSVSGACPPQGELGQPSY
jgi:hypothetical protein